LPLLVGDVFTTFQDFRGILLLYKVHEIHVTLTHTHFFERIAVAPNSLGKSRRRREEQEEQEEQEEF
jgi:hypothetical protein